MVTIVGIQFQKNGALYYYDMNQISVSVGDYVIVETGHGVDLGEVVVGSREVEDQQTPEQIKKILRIATQQDIQHSVENREREQTAYKICQKKIIEHKLEMKLVSVEYAFDNSKILFFFTANGRIDFRSLVKDLASVFKTRIELRQIGVRDEARMLGGLGQCGRPICCGTFLEDFQPVSIKMAKEQNLSLNPTKISGMCGRLMCCLKYEQEQYEQTRKKMPKMGREIRTPEGTGTVVDLNILKETVTVRFQQGDSSETKTFTLEDLARPAEQNDHPVIGWDEFRSASSPQRAEETEPEKTADPFETDQSRDEKGTPKEENGTRRKPRKPAGGRGQQHSPGTNDQEEKAGEKPVVSKLGQPVRRENPQRGKTTGRPEGEGGRVIREKESKEKRNGEKPARGKTAGEKQAAEKTARETPPRGEKSPEPRNASEKKVSSQWAKDLEKALQNIEK